MALIFLETQIEAPIERVFDLSRSIDAHQESTEGSGEVAIDGVTSGLISYGEEVEWEARHLGARRRHRSRITEFDRPRYFRDEMVAGEFRHFKHDHFFLAENDSTLVFEFLDFRAPFGFLGLVVDEVVLRSYLTSFLKRRNEFLKEAAESDRWQGFL